MEHGSLHHLCFHVLGGMSRECNRFFSHTAERLANRRKEPKIKISAWIKTRLNLALILSMLLCLRGTRTPSNIDNISEIDLCDIVAESNVEWITCGFIPCRDLEGNSPFQISVLCYFMLINMYGYIFIWSLFRYFLSLYPVIRCYGTYFSCTELSVHLLYFGSILSFSEQERTEKKKKNALLNHLMNLTTRMIKIKLQTKFKII